MNNRAEDFLRELEPEKAIHAFRRGDIVASPTVLFPELDNAGLLAFFRKDLATKRELSNGIEGYVPYGIENCGDRDYPDMIESYTLSSRSLGDEKTLEGLESLLDPYFQGVELLSRRLAWRLVSCVAPDEHELQRDLFDDSSFMRIVYYPPTASLPTQAQGGVRHGEHVDGGFITVFPFGISSTTLEKVGFPLSDGDRSSDKGR